MSSLISTDKLENLLAEIRDLQQQQLELLRTSQAERQRDIKESIELQKAAYERSKSNWRLYRVVISVAAVICCLFLYRLFSL